MHRHSLVWLVFLAIFVGLLASPLLIQQGQAKQYKYKVVIRAGNNAYVEVWDMKFWTNDDCTGTSYAVSNFALGCGAIDGQEKSVPEIAKSISYKVKVWHATPTDGCVVGDLKHDTATVCDKLPHFAVYACPEDAEVEAVSMGPVGGTSIPIDKLSLLAPYIALATVVVAVTAGATYARKRWVGKTVIP